MKSLFFTILAVATFSKASATIYYVSSTGNDSNSGMGMTTTTAWRTVSPANLKKFLPGDQLLFEGGKTFTGNLKVDGTDGGDPNNPVIIKSYGTGGRAIISAATSTGLIVSGTTGVKISNLNFVGPGRAGFVASPPSFIFYSGISLIDNAKNITVDQVETSKFQYAGVRFEGCSTLTLSNIFAHDNGYAGFGGAGNLETPQNTNITISNCTANNNEGDPQIKNNQSGNGIIVSTNGGTIKYCEAARNGLQQKNSESNGPAGIWCVRSNAVTIQYCIAHNNGTPTGQEDGGGFDLDGGVTNSVVEYCYAYENKNFGFLAFDYGAKTSWNKNTFRYNISANNDGPGLKIGYVAPATTLGSCYIYNNVFYSNKTTYPAVGAFKGVQDFNFYNNVFVVGSVSTGTNPTGVIVVSYAGFKYLANDYFSLAGSFRAGASVAPFATAGTTYTSLTDWAAAGQEKVGGTSGKLVGLNVDPKLTSPASYPKLTDPTQLRNMTAFLLQAGSPLINKGLDVGASPYSVPNGTGGLDFYGKPAPFGGAYDIGSDEKQTAAAQTAPAARSALAAESATASPQALSCYPNPATDVLRVVLPASDADATLALHDQLGRVVLTYQATDRSAPVELNTSKVAAGLYLLHVQQAGQRYQQQVAITR